MANTGVLSSGSEAATASIVEALSATQDIDVLLKGAFYIDCSFK